MAQHPVPLALTRWIVVDQRNLAPGEGTAAVPWASAASVPPTVVAAASPRRQLVTSPEVCSWSKAVSSSAKCWRARGHRVDLLRELAEEHPERMATRWPWTSRSCLRFSRH
jgi:hypothetical protein